MRFLNSFAAVASLRGFVAALLFVAAPSLVAAQTCPDYSAPALSQLDYSVEELMEGVEIEMLAGGDVDISNCGIEGYGNFVTSPDFELTLADMPANMGIMFGVDAACDTMLLVNGPDGSFSFNDDFDNTNPVLGRTDGAGIYDIWVGTYGTEVCDAKLMIAVAEDVASLGDLAADGWTLDSGECPDPSLEGAVLSLTSAELTAGHVEAMLAGGDVDLANCANLPGFGNVITTPDYDLDVTGMAANSQLVIGVESECDTILLVNDPTGEWHYNDDANNSVNAEVKLAAGDGRYDVWVGTYGSEICDANLTFKEVVRRTK